MTTEETLKVTLKRKPSTDQGTLGELTLPDGLKFATMELPWRNNLRQKSSIPAGTYKCSIVQSPRFGRVYGVHDVPGRSHILFHAGNVAGNKDLGFKTDVEGCILLGLAPGRLYGQTSVISSKVALKQFMDAMDGRPFELEITE